MMMKPNLIILFIFIVFSKLSFAQNEIAKPRVNEEIEAILLDFKKEFAPDSRTVYFQYAQDEDGKYIVETTAPEARSFILNKEKELGKNFSIQITNLPESDLKGQEYGIINLSVANLRTRPSHSAEMATQALLGTPVDVLKKSSGFYLVRTPEGYLSWVDRYGVALLSKAEAENWQKSKRLIYIEDFGYAFQNPDEKSARISDIVLGDIVKAGKVADGFQEIFFPDGRQAFVPKASFEDFESWKRKLNPQADGIIETAKTMIGVPYLWGGTSIKGVDCSGFTKTAFFMNGLVLPRDASQQITKGLALDVMTGGDLDVEKAKRELKKGDLIFFSASKNTNPRQPITHVAIYMDNGEFIHAAGRVRINSFDPAASNYDSQSETIVAAHRYLGNVGDQSVPLISAVQRY
jgi:hypothetical protein